MNSPDTGQPRVLVLLASYNGAMWIREQLRTIVEQKGVNVLVMVRDDGSIDETREIVAEFGGDGRILLSPDFHSTASAAQNFFALIRDTPARGFDFVAFADQDDLWNHDKLQRACQRLASDGSAAYSSATTAVWQDGKATLLALSAAQNDTDFLFEGAGQGCTFVLSAQLYEQIRSVATAHPELTGILHYHDWMVYALARAWGLRWSFDVEPSMIYRQHTTNDTGARGSIRGLLRRLTLLRNGWYREQLNAICAICEVAAPGHDKVTVWRSALSRPGSAHRRLEIARFCLRGGRRRTRDNIMLVIASLLGWI